MNDAGLWMIISAILSVLIVVELASRSVMKAHHEHQLRQVRVDYLNKVNNLPGDEAEYVRFMNAVWGAMYDDPNSWEYPDQIVRHVDQIAKERAKIVNAAAAYWRLMPPMYSEIVSADENRLRFDRVAGVLDEIQPNWRTPEKGVRQMTPREYRRLWEGTFEPPVGKEPKR